MSQTYSSNQKGVCISEEKHVSVSVSKKQKGEGIKKKGFLSY